MTNVKIIAAAGLLVLSQAAIANNSSVLQNSSFYIGLGMSQLNIDNYNGIKTANSNISGLNASLGGLIYLPYKTTYVDVGLLVSGNSDTLSSGTCSTTKGTLVSCNEDLKTSLIAIPVTINYYTEVAPSLKLNAGLGLMLSNFSRKTSLTSTGYESKDEDSKSATTFSPALQLGVSYKQFRIVASTTGNVGDKTTGSGSTNNIQVQWGTKF